MAHSVSTKKALRKSEKARARNRSVRSGLKTRTTKAEKLVKERNIEAAPEAVKQATSSLDRAAQKGVIHANAAARRKSRLVKKLNAVPVKQAAEPKRKRTKKAETESESE
ncbi:30S ribosomal protein S20 [Chloroflexota bacterium]